MCFDQINGNHGVFSGNSGAISIDHRKQMNMKYIGELQSILPFFYIISIEYF